MSRRKDENSPYERTLRRAEKSMIEFAVEQAGSLRAAAPLLGVSISFLIGRAKKLNVDGKKAEDESAPESTETEDREKDSQDTQPDDPPPDNVVPLTPLKPLASLVDDGLPEAEEEAPLPEGA